MGWVTQRELFSPIGLQVPPQKVFGPSKPTPNTFETKVLGALFMFFLRMFLFFQIHQHP